MKKTVKYLTRLFKDTECSLCGHIIPYGELFLEKVSFDINLPMGVEQSQKRVKVCLQCSLREVDD